MMKNNDLSFAEVIDSNLSNWTGQCWKWNIAPQFGELVVTKHNNTTIFGIVQTITTGSFDPVRVPMPLQQTEDELARNQPQIFEFLITRFTCIAVGYQHQSKIYYHTPSFPAKIHGFIDHADVQSYTNFFENEQFLHMIWHASTSSFQTDEMILAIIKQLCSKQLLSTQKLMDWIDTFSTLSKHDYQRIKILLKRIQAMDLLKTVDL